MSPTFLVISIVLFALWCLLLVISRATRGEQLVLSLVGLALAPAIVFLALQMAPGTSRQLGVEDFLFALSFFGIAAVIYEVMFGRHFVIIRSRVPTNHPNLAWIARLFLVICAWIVISVLCFFILQLPMVRAMLAGALLIGVYVIAARKDLLGNALATGTFMAALIFVCELLLGLRFHPTSLPSAFMTVSFVHLVWAAVVGFAIGPLYEYVRHLKAR